MNNSTLKLPNPGQTWSPDLNGWCAAFGILAICIIAGNTLAIAVLTRKRLLRRRTSYFLLSLTVADMLVGTISVPTFIYQLISHQSANGGTILKIIKASDVFCSLASTFTLTIIALERVFAITFPLQHRVSTKRLYYVLVSSVWILAGVLSSLYFFHTYKILAHDVFFYFMMITFFLSLFVMLVAYVVIWFRVTKTLSLDDHKHKGSISATDSFPDAEKLDEVEIELTLKGRSEEPGEATNDSVRQSKQNTSRITSRMKRSLIAKENEKMRSRAESEKKLAVTLFIVTAVFVVTWLPFQIINLIYFACFRVCPALPPMAVIYFCKLLNYSNSLINPVVYSLRLPEFRLALQKIILKRFKCLLCLE